MSRSEVTEMASDRCSGGQVEHSSEDVQAALPDWMGCPATKADQYGLYVLTLTGRCSCGNWRYIVAPDWKVPAEDGGGYMTDQCHQCLGTMEFEERWERVDRLVSSYAALRPTELVTDGGEPLEARYYVVCNPHQDPAEIVAGPTDAEAAETHARFLTDPNACVMFERMLVHAIENEGYNVQWREDVSKPSELVGEGGRIR